MLISASIAMSALLARTAADRLPIERRRELIWLILFVAAAGVTLLVVVMMLMRVWRRNVLRLQKERRQLSQPLPDIWKAGGDRLIAKMSPFPKPPPRHSDSEAFDDDDSGVADMPDMPDPLDDLFGPEDEDDDAEPDGPDDRGPGRPGPPPRRPR